MHGKGTETLNLPTWCYECSFSCRNQEGCWPRQPFPFPGLGGGEGQWSPRALRVLEPSMQGSPGPHPALPVLCGLGQITQRCFQTDFYGPSVHLDYSPLVQERNVCSSTAGVSVHQTLRGSVETSRKATPAPGMDSSHQTLHTSMLDTYTCYVAKGVWDHLLKVPLAADPDLLSPLSDGKDVAGL